MFEPLCGITNIFQTCKLHLSEILGVEDRGGYYESSGALLKDMCKNHHVTNGCIISYGSTY